METIEESLRAAALPSPTRMVLRGAAKRCASCGGRGLFAGWFRMAARCPRCGYRFEREEGFFLGAYVMNLVIAQALVVLLAIVPAIVLLARDPGAGLLPVFAGGMVGAVLAPVVFYPFSKTLWVAFELIMRPAGAVEPTDARP